MGKIVIAFLFFLAASTLAIREARPLPAPEQPRVEPSRAEPPLSHEPPSRAVHDTVPPWVRLAPPPPSPVAAPVIPPPVIVSVDEPEPVTQSIDDDIPDTVDRCPDQPETNADDDGCPEPFNGPAQRIIKLDIIY